MQHSFPQTNGFLLSLQPMLPQTSRMGFDIPFLALLLKWNFRIDHLMKAAHFIRYGKMGLSILEVALTMVITAVVICNMLEFTLIIFQIHSMR